MRNPTIHFYKYIGIFLVLSCSGRPQDRLIIATAANVQFAMDKIVSDFSAETGVQCDVIISSSGKITAQILEGAPFDVFISADMAYPQRIYEAGLSLDPPLVYARGKLVLWSIEKKQINHLKEIANPDFKFIALANPEVAPYGKAAKQTMEYYQIYDKVKEKCVYGESVAQVNQFIISEAVAAGFTAKSVVLSPKLRGRGSWIDMNAEAHDPIDQGVIILKNSPHVDLAIKFKDFLLSADASATFAEYGYEILQKQ